ncbi:hypothetical protein CPL00172_CDS0027 [Escherichia phage BubbaBully]|nr:MAG TPA: hypothetical protein [Caudoviricetes sp.]
MYWLAFVWISLLAILCVYLYKPHRKSVNNETENNDV